MKKNTALLLIFFAFIAIVAPGCIKDQCKSTYHYTYYVPVYKTTAEVRANIRSSAPQPVQRPGKIYVRGSYIFLNEIDKGIHVIDNSNPSAPVNKAFVDIPGNMDLAVKGNTLYADLYTDLVSIDISNPLNIVVTKVLDGVFPFRSYGNFTADRSRIIVDWQKRDTTVVEDCHNRSGWVMSGTADAFMNYSAAGGSGSSTASVSPYGVGGSMARFAIVGDRLYTVSDRELNVFSIANATPSFTKKNVLGWNIETLYPFKNNLFIGSTTGMFVYNISNPDNPVQTGQFSHVRSCDPVIADDQHAFVTLRSGNLCGGFTNQMDVLKLNTLTNPTLLKTYQLSNPHGLAKDGNLLLICDGKAGLKLFDATNVLDLKPISTITTLETYDVIALGGTAIVVAKDGLYQYDYTTPSAPRLLSKMVLSN